MKQFNLSFALDDYCTGYSSLSYLRKLAVHTIKIDQSFVRDKLINLDDLNIVEGVETIKHGIKMAALKCTSPGLRYCPSNPHGTI